MKTKMTTMMMIPSLFLVSSFISTLFTSLKLRLWRDVSPCAAMNSIAVFDNLRNLLATSQKFQQVASSLPSQDQQLLQTVSQFKDEELPLPGSVPIV